MKSQDNGASRNRTNVPPSCTFPERLHAEVEKANARRAQFARTDKEYAEYLQTRAEERMPALDYEVWRRRADFIKAQIAREKWKRRAFFFWLSFFGFLANVRYALSFAWARRKKTARVKSRADAKPSGDVADASQLSAQELDEWLKRYEAYRNKAWANQSAAMPFATWYNIASAEISRAPRMDTSALDKKISDAMGEYRAYVFDCRRNGDPPKDFSEWLDARGGESDARA